MCKRDGRIGRKLLGITQSKPTNENKVYTQKKECEENKILTGNWQVRKKKMGRVGRKILAGETTKKVSKTNLPESTKIDMIRKQREETESDVSSTGCQSYEIYNPRTGHCVPRDKEIR